MRKIAYQLHPKSAFHFGREGLEQHTSGEVFPSDSLFSAIVATLAVIQPEAIDDFLQRFPPHGEATPLRLSSVFPRVGDLPLLPKPRRVLNIPEKVEDHGQGKRLKKLRYVSPAMLRKILDSQPLDMQEGVFLQEGAIWITRDELSSLPATFDTKHDAVWQIQLAPRVTVDRMTQESNVYQTGRTLFAENCGLWFMAEVADDSIYNLMQIVLEHLSDTGIGGERAVGYGGFTWTEMPVPDLPAPTTTSHVMLLSRYNPTHQEVDAGLLNSSDCAYDIVDVGGWTNSLGSAAHKRQRVRMLEVGSIVKGGHITGQLVDVTPEMMRKHRVYRSGIALAIGAGGTA
jgi:CRISPR-associated protein Csm4